MSTQLCDCMMVGDAATPRIERCPLHAAAPDLLAALKAFLTGDASVSHMKVAYEDARIAVAEAEGELRK